MNISEQDKIYYIKKGSAVLRTPSNSNILTFIRCRRP